MVTTRSASHALLSSPAPAAATTTIFAEAPETAVSVPSIGERIDGDAEVEAEAELPLRTRTRSQRQSRSQTPSPSKKRKSPAGGSLSPSKRKKRAEGDGLGEGTSADTVAEEVQVMEGAVVAPKLEAEVVVAADTQDVGAEALQREGLPQEPSNGANDLSDEGAADALPAEFLLRPSIADADLIVPKIGVDKMLATTESLAATVFPQPSPTAPVAEEEKKTLEKVITENHIAKPTTAGPGLPEVVEKQYAQEEVTADQPEEEMAGVVPVVALVVDGEGTTTMPIGEVPVSESKDGENVNLEEMPAGSLLEERANNVEKSTLRQPEIELQPPDTAPSTHVKLGEVDQGEDSVYVLEKGSFLTTATSKPEHATEDEDDDAPDVLDLMGPGIHNGGVALPRAKPGRNKKTRTRLQEASIDSSRVTDFAMIGEEPMVTEDSPMPDSVPAAAVRDEEGQQDVLLGTSKKRKHSVVWSEPPVKKAKDVVKDGTIYRRVLGVPSGVASLSQRSTTSLRKGEAAQNGRSGRLSLLKDKKLQTTWAGRRSTFVKL